MHLPIHFAQKVLANPRVPLFRAYPDNRSSARDRAGQIVDKEGETGNVVHCRCSLTPAATDAAGRSQKVIRIGSKALWMAFN